MLTELFMMPPRALPVNAMIEGSLDPGEAVACLPGNWFGDDPQALAEGEAWIIEGWRPRVLEPEGWGVWPLELYLMPGRKVLINAIAERSGDIFIPSAWTRPAPEIWVKNNAGVAVTLVVSYFGYRVANPNGRWRGKLN